MSVDKDVQKLSKRFGLKLKQARIDKGLTQEDMTSYGFNYRHYQKLESGTHTPSMHTLVRLSRIFGIKASEFID